jgi:protein MpaA
VISIHQPVDCIDYDGPGKRLAEAMAAQCPLMVKKLGGRPGSFGSFVGETLGKPIITLELPENAGMDAKKLWNTYGDAMIAALRYDAAAGNQ